MQACGQAGADYFTPEGRCCSMIRVTDRIALDEGEIEESFVRAGGPGGQNVNKVATAVQLRFDAAGSPSLDEPMRLRLRRHAGRRMTADGVVVIMARRFRTQERNRQDAYERLIDLIQRAAEPEKRRIATRPTAASRERHRETKLARARTKRHRQPVARPVE
jgi:ribosome-associated protein